MNAGDCYHEIYCDEDDHEQVTFCDMCRIIFCSCCLIYKDYYCPYCKESPCHLIYKCHTDFRYDNKFDLFWKNCDSILCHGCRDQYFIIGMVIGM